MDIVSYIIGRETAGGSGGVNINAVADRSLSGNITLNTATTVGAYAFANTAIKAVSAPLVTTILSTAFNGCTSLKSISFPVMVGATSDTIKSSVFAGCTSLTDVDMPLLQNAGAGSNMFKGCTSLKTLTLPSLVRTGTYMCEDCTSLETVDLSNADATFDITPQIQASAFNNCSKLTTLTIHSTTIFALANANAFNGCTALAHIYVPADLVDTYKAATNWTTYASIIEAIPAE